MKKHIEICIILLISIFISMFIPHHIYAIDENKMYYEEGFSPIFYNDNNKDIFESIKDVIPQGTPSKITVSGNIFPFNYRLWFAKNIVVYGDYSTVNTKAGDFKAESDSPYGIGYYSKNGTRGEYRYHGFDVSGNKYSNTWWTKDAVTTSSINDNNWLYRPWDEKTHNFVAKSPYNKAAEDYRTLEERSTRAWINRPIVKDGVLLTFENGEVPNGAPQERLAYRYIHIMSPPTILYPGEGKAWHKYNNQFYYRTFTLDKLEHEDKIMTDVKTTIKVLTPENELKILDFGTQNPVEYLESEISVEVEVDGVLLDDEFYNDPVKRTARYTRDDIEDWTISLGSNVQNNVKSVDYNKGKAIFILKYKVKTILQQNTYPLNANARANFKNNKSSENNCSIDLIFSIEKALKPAKLIDKSMTDTNASLEVLATYEELTVIDYGDKNTQQYLNGMVTVPVKITGILLDEAFFSDAEEREKRYNRNDIHSWTMCINDEIYPGIQTDNYHKNMGEAVITLAFRRGDIFNNQTWQLDGYAESLFIDGKSSRGDTSGMIEFTIQEAPLGEEPQPEEPIAIPPEPLPPPVIIEPKCNMPEIAYDIVPFSAADDTDMEFLSSRTVYVNGIIVNDNEFFSGCYIFGDGNEGMKKIDVMYESIDGITTAATEWVYVYSTKPVAQFKLEGTFKENRKIKAVENCQTGNIGIVLEKYPIVSYEWTLTTVNTSMESLKVKTPASNLHREFLCKEPGIYRVELIVVNTLGRKSDPYILDFVVYEDTPPAIEMNIWNGVLTRGEELNLYYSVASVDKDSIASKTLKIFYDSDNDGICDQMIKMFADGIFTGYVPDKVGKYKLVAEASEEFGQDTLPEFISETDKKRKIFESEFWTDNLAPMTDLYIDAPTVRPEIDLYIMLDKNLNDDKKQYITSNRINFNNSLRMKNMLPVINTWDMKTYQYSQTVNDTYRTGTTYPPGTMLYSSGGYSGTLSRYNVVDNGEYRDYGSYVTQNESREFARTHSNTIIKMYWDGYLYSTSQSDPEPSSYYINEDGFSGSIPKMSTDGPYNYQLFDYLYGSKEFIRTHNNTVTDYYRANGGGWVGSTESNPAPYSYYINEDGYSGYIPRVSTEEISRTEGYTYYDGYYCWYVKHTFIATYTGTLQKLKSYKTSETYISTYRGTLTKSVQIWVPDVQWISDYIGYYSGNVYKYVRQSYADCFRATSDKYIVYISDGVVSELSDLQTVMSKLDAQLILVGNNSIKNQISYSYYISNEKPIDIIMKEVLEYIGVNSPAGETHYIIVDEDLLEIKTMDFDEENDEIVEQKFQYVQDEYWFDNPTGMESFAVDLFSKDDNWIEYRANSFSKTGRFEIYRRIKDRPSIDQAFINYSYYSGIPEMTVYAHRKPIANAALTWDYDTAKGLYKTDWVCLSYDWDHQYSRQDRGIVERKIMFRKNMGEWNYYIPQELTPGNYELKYFVKDVEGVWSDAFVMNFTLNDAPAMQFVDAKLKPEKSEFTINAIPASENLEIYDAHTRYPYEIKLEMALYNGNTRIGPIKTIFYDSSIAIKNGNDIHWNSIIYQIPNNIQDGNYTFKIEAIDINNANIREGKIFNVGVFTPVELVPNMPEKVIGGMNIDVSAFTSKYASVVNAVIFSGTNYQCNLNLSSKLLANTKEWENKYNIPLNIPEGKYETKYTAITPAGKSETKSVEFEVESLQITGVTIEGYWNHWRGQKDIFGKQLLNQPHRFLGLEKVKININTDGYADKVEVRFSPELEAMNYIDEYGNYYDYAEDFNLDYVYFPKTILLDETKKENNVYWEYVLPLAKSTISWDDQRIKTPYKMEVTAWKGEKSVEWIIDDIDITGNIYDLTYIQPIN